MNKWISVKDRLPDDYETVLVCCSGAVSTAWIDDYGDDLGKYWEDAYESHLKGITHWMPLPEPPKI